MRPLLSSFCLLFLAGFAACHTQYGDLPLLYGGFGTGYPSGVLLETFYDTLCPNSHDSNQYIQEIIQEYNLTSSGHLYLNIGRTILPYHTNSFYCELAIETVLQLQGKEAAYEMMTIFWDHIAELDPQSTNALSQDVVIDTIIELAAGSFNIDKEMFRRVYFTDEINNRVRTFYKYAASRQVDGTPTFFLNGKKIDQGDILTKDQWIELFKSFGVISNKTEAQPL